MAKGVDRMHLYMMTVCFKNTEKFSNKGESMSCVRNRDFSNLLYISYLSPLFVSHVDAVLVIKLII